MKLRIKGNSIRFRLSQGDLTKLNNEGSIISICSFGKGVRLSYSVRVDYAIQDLQAHLEPNHVILLLPTTFLKEWHSSERVGYTTQIRNGEEKLDLILEKDWQCLKPRSHEDESDLYVHPESHG